MKNPEKFLDAIKDRAMHNPEFIHLLKLQKWFPTANINKLLKGFLFFYLFIYFFFKKYLFIVLNAFFCWK
jgi:hypothetical protein